ncbi:MAG: hypothetical protein ACM33U_11405 [Solirubrobacterales bacterium]
MSAAGHSGDARDPLDLVGISFLAGWAVGRYTTRRVSRALREWTTG